MNIVTDIGPFLKEKANSNLKKGFPLVVFSYLFMWITGTDFFIIHVDLGKIGPPSQFLAGIIFAYGLWQFMVPAKYYRAGLNGERKVVNNISTKLGSANFLFNDISFKDGNRGNIDHIIVSEHGIFVIETKNIEGEITIDENYWKGKGFKQSPSNQAITNAARVRELLENQKVLDRPVPYVNAIVVLTNPKLKIHYLKKPSEPKIIDLKDENDSSLKDYVLSFSPTFLTYKEVTDIVSCIDYSRLSKTQFSK